MKPLEVPSLEDAKPGRAWAFLFDYIRPSNHPKLMQRIFPSSSGPISAIPSTGPAPVLMHVSDWEKVTPEWERLAAEIEADAEMKEQLGWVREMYGFSAALALLGIDVDVTSAPNNRFIAQLPVDKELGKAHAFHYTFCTIYRAANAPKDEPNIWCVAMIASVVSMNSDVHV